MDDQRTRQRVPLDKCTTIVEGAAPSFNQRYRLPARDISDQGVALHVPKDHPVLDDFSRILRNTVRIRCPRRLTRQRKVREGQLFRVERHDNGRSVWVFKFKDEFPLDDIKRRPGR